MLQGQFSIPHTTFAFALGFKKTVYIVEVLSVPFPLQLPEKSELQTLDLSNNLIKNMSYDAFDNLDNLQTLMLSYNKISSIVDDIFEWNPLKLQVSIYLDLPLCCNFSLHDCTME